MQKASEQDCLVFRECLDFVISNLKFSLVHHQARVDGTMEKAWNQELALISDQVKVLEKYPGDIPKIQMMKQALKEDEEKTKSMMALSKDPQVSQPLTHVQEHARLESMNKMHHRFVRTMESLIPLLNEACPNVKDSW